MIKTFGSLGTWPLVHCHRCQSKAGAKSWTGKKHDARCTRSIIFVYRSGVDCCRGLSGRCAWCASCLNRPAVVTHHPNSTYVYANNPPQYLSANQRARLWSLTTACWFMRDFTEHNEPLNFRFAAAPRLPPFFKGLPLKPRQTTSVTHHHIAVVVDTYS